MLVYYMLCVTAPNFLFHIGIGAAGKVISRFTLVLLGFHCFLEPFCCEKLNGGRQISHLLVAPIFEGLLCITGLMRGRHHGITHLVVPVTFLGVVSQMGVVGRLDMYRTKVLMYRTMVLLARLTKVRC